MYMDFRPSEEAEAIPHTLKPGPYFLSVQAELQKTLHSSDMS